MDATSSTPEIVWENTEGVDLTVLHLDVATTRRSREGGGFGRCAMSFLLFLGSLCWRSAFVLIPFDDPSTPLATFFACRFHP